MAEETKEAGLEPAVDGEPGTAPPASVPSASGGLAQRLARRGFRPEEVAIAITLVLGVGICLATGTGFETSEVFWGYLRYFGAYLLYLFAVVRVVQLVRVRWRPEGRLGRALLARLGGPCGRDGMFDTDIEFLRGFLLLLITITVYTNVKARIPLVNPTVGDPFFQAFDNALLGTRLVPWLEKFAELNPVWRYWADRVYNHGFVWMILLVGWFWIRNERRMMRWLFTSFCLIYMLAIFVTLLYPSYGPFFLEWEHYRWASKTMSGMVQSRLVNVYLAGQAAVEQGTPFGVGAFYGIAAFPSLHVAFMVMLTVVGWRTARLFAVFMIGVAIATTISTLMFGWHYFVDAPAGALVAIVVPLAIRKWVFARDDASG